MRGWLRFDRRCALPMRGEKKFQAGLSWYFHTISFVTGLISITLEYGIESSRRCTPIKYKDITVTQHGRRMLAGMGILTAVTAAAGD